MRYNGTIIDLYDRSVIGCVNSKHSNTEPAKETLSKAIAAEKSKKDVILHSEPGCQYTSWAFVDYCKSNGIIQSRSKAGCPYDNAPMERFYNTQKNEWIYLNNFYSDTSLDEAIKKYVFVWYNHIRPHSYNNGLTPFEAR